MGGEGHRDPGAFGTVAESFAPEVVLLDLAMPVLDGYEVAALLRDDPVTRGSVLVALTGYGQERDRARTKAAGFAAHLVKPVQSDRLLSLLGEIEQKLNGLIMT
ncbi:MAG: response regulator [Myxococcales bacterium]|nr:response regulator [Myxococcales bacterium]